MERYLKNQNVRIGITLILGLIITAVVSNQVITSNSVFSLTASEHSKTNWQQVEDVHTKKNLAAMKLSYNELISFGSHMLNLEDYDSAIIHFSYAKTLFPDRSLPRKNLCYSYLMKCQEDWRYCDKARKEIYYAMQTVSPSDTKTYEYIKSLVALTEMTDIVKMEENEALAAIY